MNLTLVFTLAAALATLLTSPIASAAEISEKAIGSFELKGDYWQRVKITKGKKDGQFVGSFDVATRGCQGDAKMTGKAQGPNAIQFSQPSDVADGGVCRINVTFSDDYSSIEVSHTYCGLSGAACDFNGKLKRTGKR